MPKEEFEVIVVDNGSTDETPRVVSDYSNRMHIQSVYDPRPGLHVGRHQGLSLSHANELVFIDDDIEANPVWLETIWQVFQSNEKIAMVGGKNLPKYESTPPFWILELWNKRISLGHVIEDLSILDFGDFEREVSPYYIFGCNFGVRKKIILDAEGFHPDGFPFDLLRFRGDGETHISDYVLKEGLMAYYHPGASVYHWVSAERMTEEYFCKRRYMQGVSAAFKELRSGNQRVLNQPAGRPTIKQYIKSLLGTTQIEMLNEILKNLRKTDFEKRLNNSYLNGKEYLIHYYNNDESMRKWVHQKNYF
jgi:glycosyltransferase involved in cell wall biosynthesis